jgi:hypothetical protein
LSPDARVCGRNFVSSVLYIINFDNCNQNGPKKARKEAKEGRDGKESNHNQNEGGNCAEI